MLANDETTPKPETPEQKRRGDGLDDVVVTPGEVTITPGGSGLVPRTANNVYVISKKSDNSDFKFYFARQSNRGWIIRILNAMDDTSGNPNAKKVKVTFGGLTGDYYLATGVGAA